MKLCLAVCLPLLLWLTAQAQTTNAVGDQFGGETFAYAAQIDVSKNANALERISSLIHSYNLRDRAWGAYFVGRYHLDALSPTLIELLDGPDGLAGEQEALRFCVLDSLIQIGADVPWEVLQTLFNEFPDAVFILLAKSPEKNQEALLEIARKPVSPTFYVAACNLLAVTKANGFAQYLLSQLRVRVAVTVIDRLGLGYGMSVGCGGAAGEGPPRAMPFGFPPTNLYRLVSRATLDAIVVAPGSHPIYYERVIAGSLPSARVGPVFGPDLGRREEMNLGYLSVLLDTSVSDLALDPETVHRITWRDRKKYVTEVQSIRDSKLIAFEVVKEKLIERNLLPEDAARTLKLALSIEVTDQRTDRSTPLPSISGVKTTIQTE